VFSFSIFLPAIFLGKRIFTDRMYPVFNEGLPMPASTSSSPVENLQSALGYIFVDKTLLIRALTTNGFVNEWTPSHPDEKRPESMEALCTLGDGVLKLILTHELIDKGVVKKGDITIRKRELERRNYLADVARQYDLGKYLMAGKGEEKQGVRENPNVLAETMEAVIAAIYLDAGFEATRRIVSNWECFKELEAMPCAEGEEEGGEEG
jgi:dsRNA-specific ribonuclease